MEGTFSDIEAIFDWWDNNTKSLVDYEGFINPTSAESFVETASWASVKSRYREGLRGGEADGAGGAEDLDQHGSR